MSSTSTAVKPSITKVDIGMTELAGKELDKESSPDTGEKTRMMPERQYSREELIELMSHPLSNVKHRCLDYSQNKCLVSGRLGGRWLQDHWDKKRSEALAHEEERSEGSLDHQKKKISDPKTERLRKDQEVVLSPQRRSFNSGCFVNLSSHHSSSANRRPESPVKGERGEREPSHRELPSRRIGSGRIIREPVWEFRSDKEEVPSQNNHDYHYRQRDDRYDRRSYERSHDKERPQRKLYGDRRKYEKNEPEEPEWFSSGPTSQHDTIELHGFEGPANEKTGNKKQNKNKSNAKNNRKVSDSGANKAEPSTGKKSSSPETRKVKPETSRKSSPEILLEKPRLASSPVVEKKPEPQPPMPQEQTKESSQDKEPAAAKSSEDPEGVFNFEDMLNFDALPPLLAISNGCVDEGGSGSRFSQFFRRESPSPQQASGHQDSQQSSAPDEMFTSIINDIANIGILSDYESYFAPISPAASSLKEEANKTRPLANNLLEMLRRDSPVLPGRKITKKPSLRELEFCGKMHSVEELEARLRQEGMGKPAEYTNQPSNKEDELAAFRKLMMNKQIQNMQDPKSSSHPGTVMNVGFQNHHGMNQQQQQPHGMNQQQHQSHGLNQQPQQQSHGMNQQQQQQQKQQQQQQQQQQQLPIPHDLVMKLLHVQQQQRQQEVFAKLLTPQNHLAPSSQFSVPPPMPPLSPELQMHISNAQPSKELLQRPEAQAILRSLKRGDITVLHLVEQLKRSTTLQPIHREIIASIIKLQGFQTSVTQREPSPAGLAPPSTAEQLLQQIRHNQQSQQQQQQQPQQLRIPSPHTNVMQRVPSPRELVAHTQNILQNALLKKKLEEQKENYRKRQELQRALSPNVLIGMPGSLSPATLQPITTSPTPLAFTPTSVLRKMTADKDVELLAKQMLQPDISQQPLKQVGRAIVKGNNNYSVPPPVVPPVDYMSMSPQFKAVQRNKLPQLIGNPPQPFMMGGNRNNIQTPTNRVRMGSNMIPQQQQGMTQSVQQLLMNHNYNSIQQRNNALHKSDCQPNQMMRGQAQMSLSGHNYNMGYQNCQDNSRELSSSPVSNQLARWFSPELLAQARAGKLPDMPPISPTQNMLSVEELERLQQAVHN